MRRNKFLMKLIDTDQLPDSLKGKNIEDVGDIEDIIDLIPDGVEIVEPQINRLPFNERFVSTG